MTKVINNVSDFLLSTDSLGGYGLDIIFDIAKSTGFGGIDLAMRKNLDARNPKYVKKLIKKYDIPVRIVQTSENPNAKELNQALDLCEEVGARIIAINSPKFFNLKAYNFLLDNFANYKKHNQDIKFTIINPSVDTYFALPVPKYHFRNIVEIIKKYGAYLGLDIANLEVEKLEGEFLRKLKNFIPYLSVLYLSDRTKLGIPHILPGEGILKLSRILKKLKQHTFDGYISLKIEIDKRDLSDLDKTALILQKSIGFYEKYYRDIEVDLL